MVRNKVRDLWHTEGKHDRMILCQCSRPVHTVYLREAHEYAAKLHSVVQASRARCSLQNRYPDEEVRIGEACHGSSMDS